MITFTFRITDLPPSTDYLGLKSISSTVTKDRATVLPHFDFEHQDIFTEKALLHLQQFFSTHSTYFPKISIKHFTFVCGNTPIELNETVDEIYQKMKKNNVLFIDVLYSKL